MDILARGDFWWADLDQKLEEKLVHANSAAGPEVCF